MSGERRWRARSLLALLLILAGVGIAHATAPADLVGGVLKQDFSPALRNFVVLSMLSLADATHDPMAHAPDRLIDAMVRLVTGRVLKRG